MGEPPVEPTEEVLEIALTDADEVGSPEGAAPAPESGEQATCPIKDDFLPPTMRKHVDPKAPAAIRMMAAKALVPLSPGDLLGVLFMLTFDPDEKVREAALKSAGALPDRILASGLRDEGVKPPALGFFLEVLWEKEAYAEMLVLNGSTPDEAVAKVARGCSARVAEIIGQNQLRVLRHDDIIRQLCENPNASAALIDGVCDFAVRSGVLLADVPQMKAARVRLYGPDVEPPPPGPTAEEVLGDFETLQEEAAHPVEEGKRLNLTQRVMKMSVAEKIKLATLGNKEARTLLIRDSNKLVSVAVIRSPRITDGEVLAVANNKTAPEDVLRVIYGNREWTKLFPIKLALVKNPKIPLAISLKYLSTFRDAEVKDLATNKNVPSGIRMAAKKMVEKKTAPKKDDKE